MIMPITPASQFMREAEEFEARKRQRMLEEQLAQGKLSMLPFEQQKMQAEAKAAMEGRGANVPATIQIANEMQRALDAKDMARYNMLNQVHKTMDRGLHVDPETGKIVPMAGYGPAIGDIAGYKAGGARQGQKEVDLSYDPRIKMAEMEAENLAKAREAFPGIEAKSSEIMGLLDKIGAHPGLSAAVGLPEITGGQIPFIGAIPGSRAADFGALLEQLGGKQFLEAYQSLKGGGAITEVEGIKATNAIARMQTAQSEESFKEALNEFKIIISGALDRARQKASGQKINEKTPVADQVYDTGMIPPLGIQINAPAPPLQPIDRYTQEEEAFNERKGRGKIKFMGFE